MPIKKIQTPVIKGKWSSEENSKIFSTKQYKLVFVQLPAKPNSPFQDLFEINVFFKKQLVRKLGLRQFLNMQNPNSVMLNYQLLELEPEHQVFACHFFGNLYPDLDQLAQQVLNYLHGFEKRLLTNYSWDAFLKLRTQLVTNLKETFPKSGIFFFGEFFDNFLLGSFVPHSNFGNNWLGFVYDAKKKKIVFLNTLDSLEDFLNSSKIKLSKTNWTFIPKLFKYTGINQYRIILSSSDDLLKNHFSTQDTLPEIQQRVAKFKKIIHEPRFSSTQTQSKVSFFTIGIYVNSKLVDWDLVLDKGKWKIHRKCLRSNFFLPNFLVQPFKYEEQKVSYVH
ncbi:MAG: hypothetical protein Q7S92_00180 [Candidatus Diapherotrites archaeon]|nr:hypothetical protein [Candidatus Diapherotrites archaeon]